jgi:hypothetical protein
MNPRSTAPARRRTTEPPASIEILMIAHAGFGEAVAFVEQMADYANELKHGSAFPWIVSTGTEFEQALQAQCALMLPSAHGPGRGHELPIMGDGTPENKTDFSHLGHNSPFLFGATAGIFWDACYIARDWFRPELNRLSRPGVIHAAPAEKIRWEQSEPLVKKILKILLAPGSPPITPGSVAAAAVEAEKSGHADVAGLQHWPVPCAEDRS